MNSGSIILVTENVNDGEVNIESRILGKASRKKISADGIVQEHAGTIEVKEKLDRARLSNFPSPPQQTEPARC